MSSSLTYIARKAVVLPRVPSNAKDVSEASAAAAAASAIEAEASAVVAASAVAGVNARVLRAGDTGLGDMTFQAGATATLGKDGTGDEATRYSQMIALAYLNISRFTDQYFPVSKYGTFPVGHASYVSDAANATGITAAATAAALVKGIVFFDQNGVYTSAAVTVPGGTILKGVAKGRTQVRPSTGFNGNFISFTHTQTGLNFDNTSSYLVDISIEAGVSNGAATNLVVLPSSTYVPANPETYGYGLIMLFAEIRGAPNIGLFAGTNRNNGYFWNSEIKFCKNNLYLTGCFDWRGFGSSIGASLEHNILIDGAQFIHFTSCDIFGAAQPVALTQAFDNMTVFNGGGNITLTGCSLDRPDRHAVSYTAAGSTGERYFTLTDCLFAEGPVTPAGNSAWISVSGPLHLTVHAPRFAQRSGGNSSPEYFIRFQAGTELPVNLTAMSWDAAFPPFTVSLTNDNSKVRYVGTSGGFEIKGRANLNEASFWVGTTEAMRMTTARVEDYLARRVIGTTPSIILHETDAPADSGKWELRSSAGQLEVRAINDAESSSTVSLTIRRAGLFTVLNLAGSPTSAAGLANGDVWVDTAAARVFKSAP